MQLRCRCVRGRVAEKLHELQLVRRMNSGWNEEKLMAGDRRHGCHSLFFPVSAMGGQARVHETYASIVSIAAVLPISKHFIDKSREIGQFNVSLAERRRIESNAISRRAFNFTLFEQN